MSEHSEPPQPRTLLARLKQRVAGVALFGGALALPVLAPQTQMPKDSSVRYNPEASSDTTMAPPGPYDAFHIYAEPAHAVAVPRIDSSLDVEELLTRGMPLMLADPANADSLGGRNRPFALTWNPETIDAQKLQIDAARGIVRYGGKALLTWSTPKSRGERQEVWDDTRGVHLYGAPKRRDHAAENAEAVEKQRQKAMEALLPRIDSADVALPDTTLLPHRFRAPSPVGMTPFSASARLSHVSHRRFFWTKDNIDQFAAWLRPPGEGDYHVIGKPKPHPEGSAAALIQHYDRARNLSWNLLHWKPSWKDERFDPDRDNLFMLSIARMESAHADRPGPDNLAINRWGYGGMFQPQVMRDIKPALEDAKFVNAKGEWLGVLAGGQRINTREDFLNGWEAQALFFVRYAYLLQQRVKNDYALYHSKSEDRQPHGPHITRSGTIAATYLNGTGPLPDLLFKDKIAQDASGTSNRYYLKYFSGHQDRNLYIPRDPVLVDMPSLAPMAQDATRYDSGSRMLHNAQIRSFAQKEKARARQHADPPRPVR